MAETAIANAIHLDVKKDALRQRQSGDWSVGFTIASIHMDQRLAVAPMGTQYEMWLVEINDDGTPRDHVGEQRNKWAETNPVKQAGIRCADPRFWSWLREDMHYAVTDETGAIAAVRHFCGVTSRAELAKPGKTNERERWYVMDRKFQAWLVVQNA